MSRGPRAEQIDGGMPTYRVEIESWDGTRRLIPDAEILTHEQARTVQREAARQLGPSPNPRRIAIVNERSGFTCDEISYEPIKEPHA